MTATQTPAIQTQPTAAPAVQPKKSAEILEERLGQIITLIERLGACIAVGAGAVALVYFRAKVLPAFPMVAAIIGILFLLLAFFLLFAVGLNFIQTVAKDVKPRWLWMSIAGISIIASLLFFLAGIQTAIHSINPPKEAPEPSASSTLSQQCVPAPALAPAPAQKG